jgi:hypothetical protein
MGSMIYTIAIAVCLFSVDVQACDQVSARSWIVAPEQAVSLVGCMTQGMHYAASAHVVEPGSYAKIFCRVGGGWPHQSAT